MSDLHRIPTDLTPSGDLIVPLIIPRDTQWTGLILGVLAQLEDVEYYQLDSDYGDTGAQTVTAQWRDRTITPLIEAIAGGETFEMTVPPGSSIQFFGSSAPDGWLFCDGAAISRSTYADLFAVIGTTYGNGNGSTTFNIPDMRGRVPLGAGTGTGLTARTLAATLGTETHQLTIGEMPTHNHAIQRSSAAGSNTDRVAAGQGSGTDIGSSLVPIHVNGGNQAHNNMPPSLVTNFIIKV